MKTNNEQGFSLIELMIALVLGLLVMAAVAQVYFMSAKTAVMQQSSSNILDANVFGLQYLERNLRLAGLELAEKSSGEVNGSGIIMGGDNLSGISGFTDDMATANNVSGLPTNTTRSGSDQLTIQYRAPTDVLDCQGNLALGPRKGILVEEDGQADTSSPIAGQIVVEQYYLKTNATKGNLELYCNAGRYATDNVYSYDDESSFNAAQVAARNTGKTLNKLVEMSDGGTLLVSDIDDFKVQLGVAVKQSDGNYKMQYMTPTEYKASHSAESIVAVKVAILAKGSVGGLMSDMPSDPTFQMLGESVQLNSGVNRNYLRRVYESNSMLRNSREKE